MDASSWGDDGLSQFVNHIEETLNSNGEDLSDNGQMGVTPNEARVISLPWDVHFGKSGSAIYIGESRLEDFHGKPNLGMSSKQTTGSYMDGILARRSTHCYNGQATSPFEHGSPGRKLHYASAKRR